MNDKLHLRYTSLLFHIPWKVETPTICVHIWAKLSGEPDHDSHPA